MKGKNFFRKDKHHMSVVHVPGFHLSAWSSSFFCAFFLQFYGEPFYGSPDTIPRRKLEVSPVILIVQIEWLECWENAMFGTRKRYDLEYQNQGKKWMTTHFYDS